MIQIAKQYAIKAHGDQKYGDKPYLYHLEKVVAHLKDFGPEAKAIGYLHDVVEDTEVSVKDIESQFGRQVALCVELLSDQPGKNRLERKTKTYKKMSAVKVGEELELGLIVKAADRLANLEACIQNGRDDKLSMYMGEHQQFRNAVYRKNICDDLWVKIDAIVASVEKTGNYKVKKS